MKTNQPAFYLHPSQQRLRGILILVFTNVLSSYDLMLRCVGQLWPNVLIGFPSIFFFFFVVVHKPSRLSVMDWAKAISCVWIGWQAAWKLINRNPFAGADRREKKGKLYYQFINFASKSVRIRPQPWNTVIAKGFRGMCSVKPPQCVARQEEQNWQVFLTPPATVTCMPFVWPNLTLSGLFHR